MVNFRYHLVSITAIFVAMAVGILVGVSVVNSGSIERLEARLGDVRREVADVRRQSADLERQIDLWDEFADKAGPSLLARRLQDVPVMVMGVRGTDDNPIKDLRDDLIDADADLQGTIWLTPKLRLTRPDDVETLAKAAGVAVLDADTVRAQSLDRLAQALLQGGSQDRTGSTTSTALAPDGSTTSTSEGIVTVRRTIVADMVEGGFLDIDDPPTGNFDPSAVRGGTRFIVASGRGASLPDVQGAVPLVRALAGSSGPTRVVAVESGRPAQGQDPEIRAEFIGPLAWDQRREQPGVDGEQHRGLAGASGDGPGRLRSRHRQGRALRRRERRRPVEPRIRLSDSVGRSRVAIIAGVPVGINDRGDGHAVAAIRRSCRRRR